MTTARWDVRTREQKALALVCELARLTPDGEGNFVMSNDVAVSTLSQFIRDAREVLGLEKKP